MHSTLLKRAAYLLRMGLELLVAGGILLGSAAGQTDESEAPAEQAPPAAAVFQNPIPGDRLTFMNEYAGQPAKKLLNDKRFHGLMKTIVPRTVYHYGRDMGLTETVETVIFGSHLPVTVREGRYVTVSGREGPYLDGRGFLWFDIKEGIALGGVYFHPVNGEPTPTLAIFSRQLTQTALSMSQLPLAFAEDESQWAARMHVPVTSPRYFIPDDGKKYVLVHDEDFCDHPVNAPAPPESVCEQLNLEAADADLRAAYFMKQTHNAANATAWMLDGFLPLQAGLEVLSEKSCKTAPNRARCRVRVTRQRTQALLAQR